MDDLPIADQRLLSEGGEAKEEGLRGYDGCDADPALTKLSTRDHGYAVDEAQSTFME